MLLKYINSNRIQVIVFFLLIPVLYWIPSMMQGAVEPVSDIRGVPLGRWIISFSSEFRVLSTLLGLVLVMVNGYLLIQLNTVHFFIPHRTQLPYFFYVVLSMSITQLHYLTPALVASTLVILVFYRIFHAYKVEGLSYNFLDAGLLISIASLFYFPAIFFFPALLAALMIMRPFNWREWVFSFLGLFIPIAFGMAIYYLTDTPSGTLFDEMGQSFTRTSKDLRLSQIANWSYVLLFTLITSYYMARAIDTMKIHARVLFQIFLVFFIFSVIIFFSIRGAGTGMVYFTAVPLAYLFSHYFITCERTWVNDIFFALFVLLFIWQRVA